MSKVLAVFATAALMMLVGCASDYDYGPEYGQVAAGYASPVYYDDFYGPFWDGYWGPEDAFWFSGGPGRPFHRDIDGHFRREAAAGFHPVVRGRGLHHRG